MEIIGSQAHDSIYCDIDSLFQAAEEEDMDPIKIQAEIDKLTASAIEFAKGSSLREPEYE